MQVRPAGETESPADKNRASSDAGKGRSADIICQTDKGIEDSWEISRVWGVLEADTGKEGVLEGKGDTEI